MDYNINTYKPVEILNILATIFETAREERNLHNLQNGLELSSQVNINRFSKREQCTFHYFVANGWSYVLSLKYNSPQDISLLATEEYENEIFHLRTALNLIDNADKNNACQILTNLGCAFSHVGRYIEAQYYFNRALTLNPSFGIALGNKGYGLYRYARELCDGTHQFIFLQYARKYLSEAANKQDTYPDASEGFRELAQHITTRYTIEQLDDYKIYPDILTNCSEADKDYRLWCIDNVLL